MRESTFEDSQELFPHGSSVAEVSWCFSKFEGHNSGGQYYFIAAWNILVSTLVNTYSLDFQLQGGDNVHTNTNSGIPS